MDTTVRIVRLRPWLMSRFQEFADQSTLRSLSHVRASRRVAEGQVFLYALDGGRVVGCTSYRPGHRRSYVGLDGSAVESPCVYLCSSEVRDGFQGRGIGSALYSRRLAECQSLDATAIVEILGTGTPFSVDALARRGLDWHLAHGFRLAGHSREDDAGPVLVRAATTKPCDERTRPGDASAAPRFGPFARIGRRGNALRSPP